MRLKIHHDSVQAWLSANDTYEWANRDGARWPCSQTSGHRFYACFDSNGLCDLTVDGRYGEDIDAGEFNALIADLVRPRVPADHPANI